MQYLGRFIRAGALGAVLALPLAPAADAAFFIYNASPGDAFSLKFQGVTTEFATTALSNETTWGWGYVTSIENSSTFGTIWQQDNAAFGNARLGFMIYGIADLSIVPGGTFGQQIYNVGCTGGSCDGKIHIDFYLDSSTATGGTNPGATAGGLTTADRTGFGSLNQITTDGSLFMKWELTAGHILDNPDTGLIDESVSTLFQDVSAATLPARGRGFFFADCVAGPGCNIFGDSDLIDELAGQFTLAPIVSPDPRFANGWRGAVNDPVEGFIAAPVPATVVVFGTALICLAGLGRRGRA
ncbi:MAG: hypothetical protein JNK67_08950 [Alphaproteobacteria bacterium]|nr:hypothetical protein [Alphaproteobacteria bacterium]